MDDRALDLKDEVAAFEMSSSEDEDAVGSDDGEDDDEGSSSAESSDGSGDVNVDGEFMRFDED
jgi:hypothetical protein